MRATEPKASCQSLIGETKVNGEMHAWASLHSSPLLHSMSLQVNKQCFISANLCLDHFGWQSSPLLPYTFESGLGWMPVSPLQPGEGGQSFREEEDPPHPQGPPQEPPSRPLVVLATLYGLLEEPGQQAQARQLKLNKMSSALGISQTPQRQRLPGARKSWACWINTPGKGAGRKGRKIAPDAQIYTVGPSKRGTCEEQWCPCMHLLLGPQLVLGEISDRLEIHIKP